jgi:hypothetical protein
MALVKIGETTGLDLMDVIHIYNFLSNILTFDKGEFRKHSKNKFPWCSSLTCVVEMNTKFILLPQYTYSHLSYCIMELLRKGVLDIKDADRIKPEYFTTYDIFRFEPSEDPCDLVGGLKLQVRFAPSKENEDKVELSSIYTEIVGYETKESCKDKRICRDNFYLELYGCREWLVNLKNGVEALERVIGEDYSKYKREAFHSHRNNVSKGAEDVENTFVNFLNLAYILYTEGFDREWLPEYPLFEPIIKTLQEFGDTFDKVIASMRAFSYVID